MIPKSVIYGFITGALITYMLFAFVMMELSPMKWDISVRVGFCVVLIIACAVSFAAFEELDNS